MKLLFSLCAETVILDRFNNGLSLINVVERFEVSEYPVWIPKLTFVAFLTREKDEAEKLEGKLEVSVGGTVVVSERFPLSFQGKMNARHIAFLNGVPLVKPGDVKFSLTLGELESSHLIPVVLKQQDLPFAELDKVEPK